MQTVPIEVHGLRDVFGSFPTGVTAVCGIVNGLPVGMAATSFTPVSVDPPLVLICIQATSRTWPKLGGLESVGISVLREDQELVCRALATKDADRFAGVRWQAGDRGEVLLDGSLAWLTCTVVDQIEAGDHVIVLLRILAMWHHPQRSPLVFHRSAFRRLLVLSEPDAVPGWLHDRGSEPFDFE